MSVAKFERTVARSGLHMERRHYGCVKGLDFLGRPPVLRELFVNNISCVLAPLPLQRDYDNAKAGSQCVAG